VETNLDLDLRVRVEEATGSRSPVAGRRSPVAVG
jgi:hypothetical protein